MILFMLGYKCVGIMIRVLKPLVVLAAVTTACAKRTSAITRVENKQREPVRVILPK